MSRNVVPLLANKHRQKTMNPKLPMISQGWQRTSDFLIIPLIALLGPGTDYLFSDTLQHGPRIVSLRGIHPMFRFGGYVEPIP